LITFSKVRIQSPAASVGSLSLTEAELADKWPTAILVWLLLLFLASWR
jgi:hypothetical protein